MISFIQYIAKVVSETSEFQSDASLEERAETARMIVAAPAMLTALKHARHRLQKMQAMGYPQDKTLPLVEAAIAKAEDE